MPSSSASVDSDIRNYATLIEFDAPTAELLHEILVMRRDVEQERTGAVLLHQTRMSGPPGLRHSCLRLGAVEKRVDDGMSANAAPL